MRTTPTCSRTSSLELLEPRLLLAAEVVRSSFGGRLGAAVGDTLFFAEMNEHGRELWKSDGTAAGTALVKDINAISSETSPRGNSYPKYFTNVNGTLFFSANDGVHGQELWRSDGTVAGTTLVKDLRGAKGSYPKRLENVDGVLYFTANDGQHGRELWRSDGTHAGTRLIKDIYTDGDYSYITEYIEFKGAVVFVATDREHGHELWRTDGTPEGTVLVKDLVPGPHSSWIWNLTNCNGTLLFSAAVNGTGQELWKSDGTAAGTVMVKDINPVDGSYPSNLVNIGGTLFFKALAGAHLGIWKSDGTAAGTVLLKEIENGPFDLTEFRGRLFFVGFDESGRELWTSDGTPAGTKRFTEILPGSASSVPNELTNFRGTLYFSARDGIHGPELWKTDGTPGGTVLAEDLTPGAHGSEPNTLVAAENHLFFVTISSSPLSRKLLSLAANHAPVLTTGTTPALPPIAEDATNPAGALVSSFASPLISDADGGAAPGIAVVDLTEKTNGTWQFSLNGTTWQAFGSPVEAAARLLAPDDRVRFIPEPNYSGSPQLKFRAWDRSDGRAGGAIASTVGKRGGSAPFSAAAVSARLSVMPVNDKPVLTLSGSVGYVLNAPAVRLAPSALLHDVDTFRFDGGQLRVWITQGGGGNNRLGIANGFSVDEAGQVKLNGLIIGRLVSDGFGSRELKITFNNNATQPIVQQLIRGITFRNVGDAIGIRKVLFTISDGDGGLSDVRTKTVNVT
jgi:ELWxxDGT repeat protein